MSRTNGEESPGKRQEQILARVRDFCRENDLFGGCRTVTAGVSGGADSVCLLFILRRLFAQMPPEKAPRLIAVHVHHQIRGAQADADAAFTRDLCERLGVTFVLKMVDAPAEARREKVSLEEAARNLRYRALREAASGGLIAVAHTATDQAETVLFRLARGTGVNGLAGMNPKAGDIVRPLLCLTRQDTEAFLAAQGQPYVTDSTNFGHDNARAILRADVMPGLEQINAQAVRHIADAARQLSEAGELLREQSEALLNAAMAAARGPQTGGLQAQPESPGTMVLAIPTLVKAPPLLARQAVLTALVRVAGHERDIGAAHVRAVMELLGNQTGAAAILPYGVQAKVSYGKLYIAPQSAREAAECREDSLFPVTLVPALDKIPEGGGVSLRFGRWEVLADLCANFDRLQDNEYTKFFDYDKMQDELVLRNPQKGDCMRTGAASRASLQKVLKDRKVPREKRDGLLLLASGNEVYWAVGVRRSQTALISASTKRVLRVTVRAAAGPWGENR